MDKLSHCLQTELHLKSISKLKTFNPIIRSQKVRSNCNYLYNKLDHNNQLSQKKLRYSVLVIIVY